MSPNSLQVVQVKALERRRLANSDQAGILCWQRETFEAISLLRDKRCHVDQLPSAASLPILAFYVDYGLLLINTHAAGDLVTLSPIESLPSLKTMSEQSTGVAIRLMDLVLTNRSLVELMSGFHNTQLVMICHAATEILHVCCYQQSFTSQCHGLLTEAY
jgi:hypothetical protein